LREKGEGRREKGEGIEIKWASKVLVKVFSVTCVIPHNRARVVVYFVFPRKDTPIAGV
jgi:hypothetical protein